MAATRDVVKLALCSRFAVIILQFVGNVLIPDHEAGVFNPPMTGADKFSTFDKFIFFFLGGFRRWDAVYLLHIAEHGYTFENCVAFFPFYPMIVSLVKLLPITLLSQASQLLLFAVGINLLLFAATAVILFHLGKTVVKDLELALCAAYLFCINPASIFMMAPYTETLFAFLSFLGMLYISRKLVWTGAFVLSASALTRSNGLVSVGFILHYLTQTYIFQGTAKWRAKTGRGNFKELLWFMIPFIFRAVCALAIVITPFAFYQYYIYHLFCNPRKQLKDSMSSEVVVYGRLQSYTMVGDPPSAWCYFWLPLSYSYVQNQHWGVGFLTYFQVKQIPNFILAAPVIILSFISCWDYYQKQKGVCHTLGLIKITTKKTEHKANGESQIRGWAQPDVMVYILHLLFLTVFGCLFMHIQVLTRLLFAASPVIYWFTADFLLRHTQDQSCWVQNYREHANISCWWILKTIHPNTSIHVKLILCYFLGYFVVGTLAFSNFFPWT